MEKISDFFSELKERISNPFILSYLLGWGIWNYKIVVGLLFYKTSELKLDGYNSYLNLIECNSSTWRFFWLPLFSAIAYTFVFPFIKNIILAFGSWIDTWGGNWNLNISKTQNVSSEKYLKYKIQYEEAIEKISKFANDEQQFNTKLVEAENKNTAIVEALKVSKAEAINESKQLKVNISNIVKESERWENANSIFYLDGEWFMKLIEYDQSSIKRIELGSIQYNVTIKNGQVNMMEENRTIKSLYIYSILCNFEYLIIYYSLNPSNRVDVGTWTFYIKDKGTEELFGKNDKDQGIELIKRVAIVNPKVNLKV